MKITKREMEKPRGDGAPPRGAVDLLADVPEDMWHVYQLVEPGDVLRALTPSQDSLRCAQVHLKRRTQSCNSQLDCSWA